MSDNGIRRERACNVDSWTEIIAISSSCFHTVGLKSDGTVVAIGSNSNYQCEVNTWTDIIQIAAGGCHTVGLKSDGTVVAAGNNTTAGVRKDGTVLVIGENADNMDEVNNWQR